MYVWTLRHYHKILVFETLITILRHSHHRKFRGRNTHKQSHTQIKEDTKSHLKKKKIFSFFPRVKQANNHYHFFLWMIKPISLWNTMGIGCCEIYIGLSPWPISNYCSQFSLARDTDHNHKWKMGVWRAPQRNEKERGRERYREREMKKEKQK